MRASSSALCATLAPLRSLKLLPMLGVSSLRAGAGEEGCRCGWVGGFVVGEVGCGGVVEKLEEVGRGNGKRRIRV